MDNETIISWNCNGLQPHISELLHFLDASAVQPIIIALQESNLYSSFLPSIPNYNLSFSTRPDHSPGGGTAIYFKSTIPFKQVYFSQDLCPVIEYTSVTIDHNNTDLTFTSIYIPPQAIFNLENLSKIEITKKIHPYG